MAVNVHSGSNVFVAQTLLGYLDINALQQHDGRTKVSEIMEPTLGYTAYSEAQTDDPEELKQAYQRLDDLLQDVSLDLNNAVFSLVCQIQCAAEEQTFHDGVRIGAHWVKELYAG